MADMDAQKQDLTNILKLSAQNEMGNPDVAGKVLRYVNTKGMMTSPYGKLYTQRLELIISGTNPQNCMCLFCKKNASVDGILCDPCESKYSGGKLTIKKPSTAQRNTTQAADTAKAAASVMKTGVDKFTEKIHELSGGSGKVDLRLKDLFSDVFKHHSSDESEEIFICGTRKTTPRFSEISTEWPKPWLYTRVFLLFLASFFIIYFGYKVFLNNNLLPGVLFIGSSMVPLALLIFFFEVNAPRNISIFKVIQVFLLRGVASLIAALILFRIGPGTDFTLIGSICIGLIEETGKVLVVALYVKKIRGRHYILNGMLYGAAVGAGFQVFESAGYAFRFYKSEGFAGMMDVIRIRAILAPAGHIAYTAIAGAALIIALGDDEFDWKVFLSKKFLVIYVFPVLIHAMHDWDMPLGLKGIQIFDVSVVALLLMLVDWIIILVLLHRGLSEINELE